ncbi:enhancer of mRNA-decapping protein 3 [Trichonephila clavata]|uniref:Enhancer of mRNA-decapping protein 3 n=1 Tax=Trichonephila clavata TaxID=2740835 RepID=A0A8X6M790_TRICU|nr:enhancer of mRNA-decapping protein 3 [Trichonephila clavata]
MQNLHSSYIVDENILANLKKRKIPTSNCVNYQAALFSFQLFRTSLFINASMSAMWIGSIVSVDCGDVLGVFEGEISNVDGENQTISLINVSRNSVKCQVPEVTLSTLDIKNLKLLESTVKKEPKNDHSNTVNASAPIASKNDKVTNSPIIEDIQKKKGEGKKKNAKRSENKKWLKERDEACFSVPVDSEVLDNDFDFEKNLALFDKRAVFDEIDALNKTDHVRLVDCNKRAPTKYRHDENVLASDLPILRQISVPCQHTKEYVTDSGLVVPSVTVEFKKLLYEKCEESGLMPKVRVEMIGRGACEMALHLLGGSHRLNPQNTHQRPSVVILVGSHIQGAQGVNCGRQLANHCTITTVLCPPQARESHSIISSELKLFNMSNGKTVSSVSALPTSIDLIVDALESHEEAKPEEKAWMSNARQWASHAKAPVLCLDPPPNCTSTEHNFILSPALPFSFRSDKCSIHICDIGIPKGIFLNAKCTYSSPFGSKFVIPLYPRSEST